MKARWCVPSINVLSTGCQPFPISVFFLLAPDANTRYFTPLILEAYIHFFGLQCPISLSDALAAIPSLSEHPRTVQKLPAGSIEPSRPCYVTRNRGSPRWATNYERDAETEGGPRSLQFSASSPHSPSIFGDILAALQMLARAPDLT